MAYKKHGAYQRGEVILFRHGGLDKIKRVVDTRPGTVFLLGDNQAESTDSRQFGWLPTTVILGKVITSRPKTLTWLPK